MTGAMDVLTRSTVTALKEMDFEAMYKEVDKARSVTEQAAESAKGFERAWVSAKIEMASALKTAFEPITKALGNIINNAGKDGPSAVQAFADAIKVFGVVVVKVMSVVLSAINGVILTLGSAISGLSKLAGGASQLLGQGLGGISSEEYQKVGDEIVRINSELDKLEAGDKRRVALRAERAQLKRSIESYENESGAAANLISVGENLRTFGDNFQENLLKGSLEMDNLAKSMAGIDVSVKSTTKSVTEAAKVVSKAEEDIKQTQNIIGKNDWKDTSKTGGASNSALKAARIADKNAVEAMRKEEESLKQKMIMYKISLESGEEEISLASDRLRIAKRGVIEAKKLVKESKKYDIGEKSGAKYAEIQTKAKQANLEYTKAITAETEKWESVFTSLLDGDLFGAIDKTFGKIIKDFNTGISKSVSVSTGSDLMGSIVGGFTSMGINVGIEKLISLTQKSVSAQEMLEAKGIDVVLSTSVENTLASIEDIGSEGLKHTGDMVDSLKQLVTASEAAASTVSGKLRGEDYVERTDYGFFNDESRELVSTGVELAPATIAQINAGQLAGTEYMIEKVTDSGFLGIGAGESLDRTNLGPAEQAFLDGVTETYMNGVDAMREAATVFGITEDEFNTFAQQWETTLSQLNFAGKTQQEVAEIIAGAVSSDMDKWAETMAAVTQYTDRFKDVGEGTSETMMRLTYQFESVEQAFNNLNIPMLDATNGGIALADALIEASGGMAEFKANLNTFIEGFYSEAEQIGMKAENAAAEFQRLGLAMPSSAMAYRRMVENAMAAASQAAAYAESLGGADKAANEASDAAAKMYADLIALARSMSDIFDATVEGSVAGLNATTSAVNACTAAAVHVVMLQTHVTLLLAHVVLQLEHVAMLLRHVMLLLVNLQVILTTYKLKQISYRERLR